MRWIRIADPGDSNLAGDMVDRVEFSQRDQSILAIQCSHCRHGTGAAFWEFRKSLNNEKPCTRLFNREELPPAVQRSVAVDDSTSTTMHCFLKFTDEAFRERRKQTIEMVAERTLLYTSESTAMVGRFDPVQQQVVVTPEAWGAFWGTSRS